ncbi:MAG: hypothetical protein Q7J35_03795 [Candidatus Methanoperedens sp.]|nr:hypothetical protein [Candidatus Methanoperedens sp.]
MMPVEFIKHTFGRDTWYIQALPEALIEWSMWKSEICKTIDLEGKPVGETKLLVTQRTIFIVQLIFPGSYINPPSLLIAHKIIIYKGSIYNSYS